MGDAVALVLMMVWNKAEHLCNRQHPLFCSTDFGRCVLAVRGVSVLATPFPPTLALHLLG
jgi:hypothetical protein